MGHADEKLGRAAKSHVGQRAFGDVDRTIRSSNAKEALKVWDEIYLYETNRLAGILYVPNYKDPFQARYRYERSDAEFIQALPGPADTAVGSRIYLMENWR